MSRSTNGSHPERGTEEVAAELRERLERRLGRERTEAIWRDPTNVRDVIEDEEEAASVAGLILEAWKQLPGESETASRKTSAFRQGLRLALIAAVAVWAVSIVSKARRGGTEPL